MRISFIKALSICLLVVREDSSLAEQEPVVFSSSVNPSITQPGDKIVYEVLASYDSGTTLKWPDVSMDFDVHQSLNAFKLQNTQTLEESSPLEGKITSGIQCEWIAILPGDHVIPGITVQYMLASGQSGSSTSPTLFIRVHERVDASEEPLQDIDELYDLTLGFPWWLGFVVGAMLVLVLLFFYGKRGRNQQSMDRGPLPWEKALRALDELDLEKMRDAGEWKPLYVALSWIFREYLESRYRIPALEETTREIQKGLLDVGVREQPLQEALTVLHACDQVKYAKFIPKEDECVDLWNKLKQWIKDTIPDETDENQNLERL